MNKELDIVLSQFFHSLTNTLGATNNFFNLLDLEKIEHIQTKDFLIKIESNIFYTNSMLQNIVTWYYLMNDKLFVDIQKIQLRSIMKLVLENLKKFASYKQIKFKNELNNSSVYSDENLLFIILFNLIHNAIKFSAKNTSITISNSLNEKLMRMNIKDSGIGMDEELVNKLFNLKQVKSIKRSGTNGENGMGLSLFITKKLLNKLNSGITIKSKENSGTEVILEFPIKFF